MTTERTETVSCGDAGAMDLFMWIPDEPVGSVLLIQEIFGVGAYIRAVAERLAAAGYVVGAPDVFWRFSPGWAAEHDDAGLAASFEKVQNLDTEQAIRDCVAATERLAEVDGVAGRPAVIGFCLGGTLAFGVAVADDPSCCVSYYGSGVPDMVGAIGEVGCPTLFHFGNDDPFIPNEGVDKVAAALAGHPGFVINVEAAGHAFDNHEAANFYASAPAAAAWAKTMSFLEAARTARV
jgi:carboxymethylenebutenolidase